MKTVVAFSNANHGNCRFAGSHRQRVEAAQNRERFLQQFNLNAGKLISTYPSPPRVKRIREKDTVKRPHVQALITQRLDTPLGIVSADCLPILLVDEGQTTIGAVHYSRDHMKQPFLEEIVEEMSKTTEGRIEAFLGPCLQAPSHQLDYESVKALTDARKEIERYFEPIPETSDFNFDYSGCSEKLLRDLDVHVTFKSEADSYSDTQYFSRRRRIHENPKSSPQLNISVICLKGNAP